CRIGNLRGAILYGGDCRDACRSGAGLAGSGGNDRGEQEGAAVMNGSIIDSPAWQKLSLLARQPYDLTKPGALSADNRLASFTATSAGLRLLFATQRVDGQVLA